MSIEDTETWLAHVDDDVKRTYPPSNVSRTEVDHSSSVKPETDRRVSFEDTPTSKGKERTIEAPPSSTSARKSYERLDPRKRPAKVRSGSLEGKNLERLSSQ